MNKRVLFILPTLVLVAFLIWFNLPFEIENKENIEFGNRIASRIDEYKLAGNKLPENDDWDKLEQLGFEMGDLGTIPDYSRLNDEEYELVYLEGFDGPYLMYNSKSVEWKEDFPRQRENIEE